MFWTWPLECMRLKRFIYPYFILRTKDNKVSVNMTRYQAWFAWRLRSLEWKFWYSEIIQNLIQTDCESQNPGNSGFNMGSMVVCCVGMTDPTLVFPSFFPLDLRYPFQPGPFFETPKEYLETRLSKQLKRGKTGVEVGWLCGRSNVETATTMRTTRRNATRTIPSRSSSWFMIMKMMIFMSSWIFTATVYPFVVCYKMRTCRDFLSDISILTSW